MDVMQVQNQLKDIFMKLGFVNKVINDREYLVFDNTFCKISYIQSIGGFVVETADNYSDAEKGLLEDSDWFSIEDINEDQAKIRKAIKKYYKDG